MPKLTPGPIMNLILKGRTMSLKNNGASPPSGKLTYKSLRKFEKDLRSSVDYILNIKLLPFNIDLKAFDIFSEMSSPSLAEGDTFHYLFKLKTDGGVISRESTLDSIAIGIFDRIGHELGSCQSLSVSVMFNEKDNRIIEVGMIFEGIEKE